ncbi:MAG: sigma-70 family RNA polymerase sigma factor [Planctomycetaceae bacterium]|nr:sigma-70 family RNA polymerase sigma factor [Planctomycetaceae bacterium]
MREQSKSDNDRDAIQEDGTSSDSVHGSGASLLIDPDQWVDLHGDYLYRYAFARLRDTNASEEVVQETFLAGIRFQDRYNGRGTERAWLLGILKRKLIDHVRMRARFNRDGVADDGSDPTQQLFDGKGNWKAGAMAFDLPDQKVEQKELWEVVRNCLNHMPAGQADVFVLSVMENMESEQICRELDITPSNLWVRMHRARLALARCVGARWFDDSADSQSENKQALNAGAEVSDHGK